MTIENDASKVAEGLSRKASDKTLKSSIYYTAHHNWAWVLDHAVQQISAEKLGHGTIHQCKRYKELPSQSSSDVKKVKILYALFRIEVIKSLSAASLFDSRGSGATSSVWATSLAFAFLDPKDALYRELHNQKAGYLMPKTLLLNWDIENENEIGELPSTPALLKAALGSGGFGLYFVYNKHDVLSVIKAHADRAKSFAGFLDLLQRDHGGHIPCWSLQSLVNSHRVDVGEHPLQNESSAITSKITITEQDESDSKENNNDYSKNKNKNKKRCQIRVYVVCRGMHLYMYHTYEARMPSWDVDLDEELIPNEEKNKNKNEHSTTTKSAQLEKKNVLSDTDEIVEKEEVEEKTMTVEEFEEYCCSDSGARPYNLERNKSVTERYVFDELSDLTHAKDVVGNCVREAMLALKNPIQQQINPNLNFINSVWQQIYGTPQPDAESENVHNNNEISSLLNFDDIYRNSEQNAGGIDGKIEMAIAGIDLMLEVMDENDSDNENENKNSTGLKNGNSINTPQLNAYILEINNNPAMAGENKKMSVRYKNHLRLFVKNILLLGLGEQNNEELGFESIW